MRRRRWQLLRALRVLLACLVLTLSARPAVSAPIWTEAAVLVVAASSAAHAAAGAAEQAGDHAVREVRALAAAPVPCATAPLAAPPAPPARGDVVLEDLYLHHCALLR